MTFIHACATLVVYPEKNHNVPISVLPKFKQSLYDGIMRGFNTFHTIDSQHYLLKTSVSVLTAENEKAAIATGAKNLVALGDRNLKGGLDREAIAVVFQEYGKNYDRMLVNANAGKDDVRPHNYEGLSLAPSWETTFAHEFTHLMGAKDAEDIDKDMDVKVFDLRLLSSSNPHLPMTNEDFKVLFTLEDYDLKNFPPPPRIGQKDYKPIYPKIFNSRILGSRNSNYEIRRAGGRPTTWIEKEK